MYRGSQGGVGGAAVEWVVNVGHLKIRDLSSGMPILFRGSLSKMRPKMASSSEDKGSIELRNLGLVR